MDITNLNYATNYIMLGDLEGSLMLLLLILNQDWISQRVKLIVKHLS